MISGGTIILILWLIIALQGGWIIYQSRVIYSLKHLNESRKQYKQDTRNNNP